MVIVAPGATAPISLILLMLATEYLALKAVHGLGSAATLFVLLAPYVIVLVVAVLVLLNSGAYGLSQNPTVNQVLQIEQFLSQ